MVRHCEKTKGPKRHLLEFNEQIQTFVCTIILTKMAYIPGKKLIT